MAHDSGDMTTLGLSALSFSIGGKEDARDVGRTENDFERKAPTRVARARDRPPCRRVDDAGHGLDSERALPPTSRLNRVSPFLYWARER